MDGLGLSWRVSGRLLPSSMLSLYLGAVLQHLRVASVANRHVDSPCISLAYVHRLMGIRRWHSVRGLCLGQGMPPIRPSTRPPRGCGTRRAVPVWGSHSRYRPVSVSRPTVFNMSNFETFIHDPTTGPPFAHRSAQLESYRPHVVLR